jgi:hypothetical protein
MKSKISLSLIVVAAVSLLAAPGVFAEPNMQEGTWEISGEMKLEGMPFPMPAVPIKYTQCLTKKDLVPQKKEKNQDCKMISNKIEGNTVSWVMECKDKKGITESTGKVLYKGNSFESTIETKTTDAKGAKTASTMKMSGKRTGDCK